MKDRPRAGVKGDYLWADEGAAARKGPDKKWRQGRLRVHSLLSFLEGNITIYENEEDLKKQEKSRDLDLDQFIEKYND